MRKYSLNEINAMRAALRSYRISRQIPTNWFNDNPGKCYLSNSMSDPDKGIEDELRTLMTGGVEPSEVIERARKEHNRVHGEPK
jgi:hypothetical protein